MTRFESEKILKEQFGLNSFYDEQWNAISKLPKNELTKVKDKYVEQYYKE